MSCSIYTNVVSRTGITGSRSRSSRVAIACSSYDQSSVPVSNRTRRGLIASLTLGLVAVRPASAAGTFLKSTGGRGIIAQEEEDLVKLRTELESEAWQSIDGELIILEEESKRSQEGKFCATPFGVDVVGITEAILLIGALTGGIAARQRKDELEKLNEQLRKINLQLRQQARSGTIYAPGLTYAPSKPSEAAAAARPATVAPTVAPHSNAPDTTKVLPSGMMVSLSLDEDEMSQDQIACRDALRVGKKLLKEKNGSASMVRFEKALMLSKALEDKVQERRACRGLAAASRLQGQYTTAIMFFERVLELSKEMKEFTCDADVYGTIADCYTDMGEFEKAATFYDKYISVMSNDGIMS